MPGARISRRAFVAGLVATPILAACGHDDSPAIAGEATTAPGGTTAPTTAPPPPTTTVPTPPPTLPAGIAPLTGAPADVALLGRPALVVKIDNADGPGGVARPQAGIGNADVVFEEMVEGSVTRFASVFHSTDAAAVGPVRSGRDSDVLIFSELNHPLFAWSGGNPTVAAHIRSSPIIDVGVDVHPGAYHRRSDRRVPHNLYTDTGSLYALTPAGAAPPPALFNFRAPGEAAAGSPSAGVHVEYRNPEGVVAALAAVEHRFDPSTGGYPRTQRGTPHVDENGNVFQPVNVVVQLVNYTPTGDADVAGNHVFLANLVGDGDLMVFTGGNRIDGRWHKDTPESVTLYTDTNGQPVRLTPGRTWVLLAPPGGATPL